MARTGWLVWGMGVALMIGCGGGSPTDDDATATDDDATTGGVPPADDDASAGVVADVVTVTTSGDAGAYTFAVGLLTADTGCEQYADWWEVLTPQGELVFRRILQHSHPDEQPFVREGSPVPIAADDTVIVRGHMNTTGYGGSAMRGTPSGGFETASDIGPDFAPGVETQDPLPDDCLY